MSIATPRRALVGLAAVVSLIVAGCASTQAASPVTVTATAPAVSNTVTATVPAVPSTSTPTASVARPPPAKPQSFAGVGTEDVGTITVSDDSTLRWSCPSCSTDNYQILNSDPGSDIAVNGLDQTSGTTVITTGTYHGVTVNTEGQNWAFTITSGNSTQTPQPPPAVATQTSQAQPPQSQTSPTPSDPTGNLTPCDQNISVGADTTCPFAENTFYEYYTATEGSASQQTTVQAWSPATQQYYTEGCSSADGVVDCADSNGSDVSFSQSAVVAYTPSEASTYAAAADLGPSK